MIHDPLPRRGPTIAADHRQRGPRCIDAFQAVDVEGLDCLTERRVERLDTLRVTLRSVERLFLPAASGAVWRGRWSLR